MIDKLFLVPMAAWVAIGLAGLWVAIGLGLIWKSWLEGIGRNPESAKASFVPAILALALTEAIAIYALVIAILLLWKMS